ncbi:hypothetical protein C5Y96_25400 [Blastopirellula marina]|uniref:DUF5060 domain-containing protein n=1 Tax=Blastopirellula marina TaxID=124 RepID=A0A2S8EZA9_9BACT|nr:MULTISPECIES: DUF5060 domain-containing protein [Pirellulaceae]PQO25242.1 hypothetical protein C5Y96_25400 [Blastopirellula marina]RCS41675.1 DUF5060 domain-containing protein [Bremerella cremea]
MRFLLWVLIATSLWLPVQAVQAAEVSGQRMAWHKVTLTVDGPKASETDTKPNPFTDYRMTVTFMHESGKPKYAVPGYFAADGLAAETSATAGSKWRAHVSPDKPGKWTYQVSFVQGEGIAVDARQAGSPVAGADGVTGSFTVEPSDKTGRDFRSEGRLNYVGKHYLQFAGSKRYFLKAGPDAPETLLAYKDFDGTRANKKNVPLKTWQPHVRDWREGDPTWQEDKGKGLIGAINYLSGKGCNSISFLPYNAGGDGDNVWPFTSRNDKWHYDCSKLDQWQVVFDHAQAQGLYLHFKLQETEMDDDNHKGKGTVPTALDDGDLGPERKLYCREMVARFGYELAFNWNLGEENTQTPQQQRDMAAYLKEVDPYDHLIVIHTYPNQQDKVYPELLGSQSEVTGASLQNPWNQAHERTLKWVTLSQQAGRPWVVANDEQNPAELGVPPDAGYQGFDGKAGSGDKAYDRHDIRQQTLWGTLMAGGAGVEYYFGYKLPENDLLCEDFRSRDRAWDDCRIALDFFQTHPIPFWEMTNADQLIQGGPQKRTYGFAKPSEVYLVYVPTSDDIRLDLNEVKGAFTVNWFNPREGGDPQQGSVTSVEGGGWVSLGKAPSQSDQDWLVVVRR